MKLILELKEPAAGWSVTDLENALYEASRCMKRRFGGGYRVLAGADIGKGGDVLLTRAASTQQIAGRWKIVEDGREIFGGS